MRVKLICATTADGFIARDANEKTKWTNDLALFKEQTMGKPVIMGSHTFNSMENQLKGRETIVISRNDSAQKIIANLAKKEKECFIAGGGRTNSRFANYITDLYLTPHPIFFGSGIRLFYKETIQSEAVLVNTISVPNKKNLFQYHFKIIK